MWARDFYVEVVLSALVEQLDQLSPSSAGAAMPSANREERRRYAPDDEARNHGLPDLCRRSDQPDQAYENQERADDEPGRQPKFSKPAGRREHRRELPRTGPHVAG